MSRVANTYGIKFTYDGRPISRLNVCDKFADYIEQCCLELSQKGCVEIETLGVVNNRPIRGRETTAAIGSLYKECYTSKHSEGMLRRTGNRTYAVAGPWTDGQRGSRAMDIVEVKFNNGTVLSVYDNRQRADIVKWMQKRGGIVYHILPGSVSPDHLHVEV